MTDTITEEDLQKAPDDIKVMLATLASKVYNKAAKDLTKPEVANILNLEICAKMTDMNVLIEETRPTSVQYANNRYAASVTINLRDVAPFLQTALENKENPVEGFVVANLLLRNFLASKFERVEQMLKEAVRDAQAKDGIGFVSGSRFDK